MNPHSKALDSMIGDMDDMETKKMFPEDANKGVSITISVSPQGEISQEPDGDEMNKGGIACDTPAMNDEDMGMSKGGMVDGADEDLSLPPFLRKKKKGLDI